MESGEKFCDVEDAEIITEDINIKTSTEEANERLQQQMREWAEIYKKVHTPFKKEERKVGRNETCPYCDSGLKFKKCTCFQTYGEQTNY